MIYALFGLSRRLVSSQLRAPIFVILSISQPLIYLLFFGKIFAPTMAPVVQGGDYLSFLAPGMTVFTALFGSIYISVGMLNDIEYGIFDRVMISNLPKSLVPISYALGNMPSVLVQVISILMVGVLLDGWPPGGVLGLFSITLLCAIISFGFGNISNAVGLLINKQQTTLAILNFFAMPMIFLSSLMLPRKNIPTWARAITAVNPIDWSAQCARGLYWGTLSHIPTYVLLSLLVFPFFSIAFMYVGLEIFMRKR